MKMFFNQRKAISRYYSFVGIGMLLNSLLILTRSLSVQVLVWLDLLILFLAVVLIILGLLLMAKEKLQREDGYEGKV